MNKKHISIADFIGCNSPRRSIVDFDYASLNAFNPISVLSEFFNLPLNGYLFAVTNDLEKNSYWKGISIVQDNVQVYYDKSLVQYLLENSLGQSSYGFSLKSLTEVEKEVVTKSLEKLLETLSNSVGDSQNNSQLVNLIWLINGHKLAITLPESVLSPANKNPSQSINDLGYVLANFRLLVGRTKIKVLDLHQLNGGDHLVLENSSIDRMHILGIKENITAKINHHQFNKINLAIDIEQDMDFNKSVDFGDFEIELQAEFRNVKMQLSDLMAIKQGHVIELNDLKSNEVYLTSQGKLIAKGDLVIINDKFGIAVKDVIMSDDPDAQPEMVNSQPADMAMSAAPQQQMPPMPQGDMAMSMDDTGAPIDDSDFAVPDASDDF